MEIISINSESLPLGRRVRGVGRNVQEISTVYINIYFFKNLKKRKILRFEKARWWTNRYLLYYSLNISVCLKDFFIQIFIQIMNLNLEKYVEHSN